MVGSGRVASLGRPGGNVTGVSIFSLELNAKRMELLHELVPKATAIALLMNPDSSTGNAAARETQEATRALGQQVHILRARTEQDVDAAFATLLDGSLARRRLAAPVVDHALREEALDLVIRVPQLEQDFRRVLA